jgi:hypothetical protein
MGVLDILALLEDPDFRKKVDSLIDGLKRHTVILELIAEKLGISDTLIDERVRQKEVKK